MAALSTGTYGTTPDATMDDGYDRLTVRIPPGITVNGALIALMQDTDDDPVIAELRINGPPVP